MLHRRDAVGRHTLRLRDLMVARGFDSEIFVELVDPETESETLPATNYPDRSRPGDVLLYQFATASELAPWLAARHETLVVNYHNITPPEQFAPWDNRLARHQVQARQDLRSMAPRTALAVAVSEFNRRDLEAAEFSVTAVVPPAAVIPLAPRVTSGSAAASRPSARDGGGPRRGARWLSVGRMAPNKAIEDVLLALLVARSSSDPDATLHVVGKPVVASYTEALHRFVAEAGLEAAVTFEGHVADDELAQAYTEADVLVVTSQHEGFGVPLIEAMSVGLPIVASPSGALPEVVGEAGVSVDTKDPWALAAAIVELLGDPERGAALAAAGRAQVASLELDTAGDRLIDLVCSVA
jgi:glycosyltransferase involved in cell wall biosynthesis